MFSCGGNKIAPVDLGSVNPLSNINLGGSLGTMGSIALVIGIVVVVLALIGIVIYIVFVKRQYWIKIPVYRLIGNVPTRVANYTAKEVPFGMAGDKLWRVASGGIWKFKAVKWLPVGKIQTAPREFWYYIREDGEWINFCLSSLDEITKKMGIKFVQEDMRLQRLATERLLEQRLMQKTFWEKWKDTIMLVIFFLVIAVCMVIIFYQFSKLIDKMSPMMSSIEQSLQLVKQTCFSNSTGSLIPA